MQANWPLSHVDMIRGENNVDEMRDSVKADILGAAGRPDSVVSLWSTIVTPGALSSDTLKDVHAPTFAMPDIEPKVIAYPGGDAANAGYAIIGKLGEGGMGIVFEAEQKHLRQRVALKMIKADKANDPLARNSFFYEAVVTAGLDHPGIIPVLEFGVSQDGRVFYVMKKASGVPWHQVIREKTRPENLDIFNRIADVMAYAHAQGVIHRDLKPANILLGSFGEVWVGDWGVALRRNAGGDYTHAHPGGTPQYMPPEMAACDSTRLGPRSDIYLLGAILFEIVTGTPPHTGEQPLAALDNAAGNILTPTSTIDGLLRVAYRAMATDPDQRYRDVVALQKAVRECLAEDESAALLRKAGIQLAAALKEGAYDAFQQALAGFDVVLDAYPGHQDAERGRRKAIMAYARQALANGEYDLALSIIQPEATRNREVAALIKTIAGEKKKAVRRPRRFRLANTLLGLMAFALILGGAYVFFNWRELTYDAYRSRDRSDSYFYRDIRTELQLQAGIMRGVVQNQPVRRDETLADLVSTLGGILNECETRFTDPDGATPSSIKNACDHLYGRMDSLDEYFTKLNDAVERLPEGPTRRTLSTAAGSFVKMKMHLNRYRQAEGR